MSEPVGMEFPTNFRLRVVGHTADDFAGFILESLLPFIPDLTLENLMFAQARPAITPPSMFRSSPRTASSLTIFTPAFPATNACSG